MTQREILIITEGATEREVGMVLRERKILSPQGIPKPPDWKSVIGSREGYEQVIKALKEKNPIAPLVGKKDVRILMLFDCEDSASPKDRAKKIENDLRQNDPSGFWTRIQFNPIQSYNNIFEYRSNVHIVLHISAPSVDGINRSDFDGYIVQLLQGDQGKNIAERLLSNTHRQHMDIDRLLHKAQKELTELMKQNGYPWTHAKSWLYAYITVFQYRQSHVWFAKDVVQYAPGDELSRVFASLITAWNRLLT